MPKLDNSFRVATCPFCGAGSVSAAGRLDYGPDVRLSTTPIELTRPAELWRCRACRSCFVQNTLTPETMAGLYTIGDSRARWVSKPFAEKHTPEVVRTLRRLISPGAQVLDVGANTGELLAFARSLAATTSAVELSAESRAVLAAQGHRVYASLDAAGGGYDVVTAFDLIEHVFDVPHFLARCMERLRPGGALVILTGDCECASARLAGAAWWYGRYPEHIRFPSRRYFAGRPGFESVTRTWASRPYRQGLSRGLRALAKGVLRPPYSGLPALGPDHQLVILRKRTDS